MKRNELAPLKASLRCSPQWCSASSIAEQCLPHTQKHLCKFVIIKLARLVYIVQGVWADKLLLSSSITFFHTEQTCAKQSPFSIRRLARVPSMVIWTGGTCASWSRGVHSCWCGVPELLLAFSCEKPNFCLCHQHMR